MYPTKTIEQNNSITWIFTLKGTGNGKKRNFFKELTPRSWTYELCGQGKINKSIYKQTPHTVLQKLPPKAWPVPLNPRSKH